MRKIITFMVFAFSLFLLSVSALATEYDNPVIWYYNSVAGDPVQAMHDCSDDGGYCYAVVWDNVGNKLDLFYTPNPDDFTSWCPLYPATPCSRPATHTISMDFPFARWRANWSNWHMPFGIVWSPTTNKFYTWAGYQNLAKVWEVPTNATPVTVIRDWTSGVAYPYRTIIGQGEDVNNEPFLWFLDWVAVALYKYYPYNNTIGSVNYVTGHSWSSVCLENCVAGTPTGYSWIRWYYASNSQNESGYLVFNYTRTGASPFWTLQTLQKNYATPLSDFNSTSYFLDGAVYGIREDYAGSVDGIYISRTSNFLTYTTPPTLYYAFNTSVNEDINASWGLRTESYNFYQFDRYRNTTGTTFGIGVNRENLSTLTVDVGYLHDCIIQGQVCQFSAVPVNIQIRCDDINYTSASYYSSHQDFNLPCSDNVTIVLDTTQYNPYHSEITVDLPCPNTNNIFTFEFRPVYDMPFYAYDSITFEPVASATMTLNGVPKTTDSNGKATFRVDPLTNTVMGFWTNETACTHTYRTQGTVRDYALSITHPEYDTYTESFQLNEYPDYKDFYLNPKGINVFVRIKRADGREVFPDDTGTTRIQGANKTYWYSYQKFQSEYADQYPARFLLVDNRSSFTINATFTFVGVVYDTFQYEGADYTSFNVSQDQTYTFWFVIPTIQPCERNEDCLPSYCDQNQNIFYSLTGCISNICVYSPTQCVFYCDDLIGCYKTKTTRTCNTTFDCDSICTGNFTAEIGLCASDGFCVQERYVCDSPCEQYVQYIPATGYNRTIGMCPEIFSCYIGGGSVERFLLNVLYSGQATSVNEIDTRFYCTLYNKGTKACITGISIPTSATVLNTIPDNWVYTTVGDNYVFQDISVSCSDTCNITYEYCPYDCNPETKTCNLEPISPEGQGRNIIEMFKGWWYAFFPNLYERTIMWVIIAIFLASIVEYGAGGRLGKGMGVMFGFVMMGFLLGGVFIDQMVFEIAFVFTVIAGLVVWRVWNQARP